MKKSMQEIFESTYSEELYLIQPRVTVVIPVAWAEVKEEEKVLLSKILNAVKQSLDSVVIKQQPKLDLSVWAEKPERVLCFSPAEGLPKYEVLPAQGTSVIVSPPLPDLLTNDEAKKKLWAGLKVMFS
jgi:DNA polymerase III psi subunit